MGTVKNFSLVVVNLFADLWFGLVRKPDFYDKHTVTRTRLGYVLFVTLAAIVSLGLALWLYLRLY